MLTLYIKPGCPYCAKVLAEAKELGLEAALKNIDDPGIGQELVKLGGKRQEPFMVDEEHRTKMYEADNIIRYLDETFGGRGQFHLHDMHN